MKQWICIRKCFHENVLWEPNSIYPRRCDTAPNQHFVEFNQMLPKSAEDVLNERLLAKGITIKPEWSFQQKENLLIKHEKSDSEEGDRDRMIRELKAVEVTVHPNIGMEKLTERYNEVIVQGKKQ